MRNQSRARLSDRSEQREPVITYSRMPQPDDGDGRKEPRLTLVRAPRMRDEVAVPVDDVTDIEAPPLDAADDFVADEAPVRPRRSRGRRSGSGARLAVVIGILALLCAGALLIITYGGAIKTAVVTPSDDSDRILQPDAGATPDSTANVVSSPDAQTSTVTRAAPPTDAVVPPIPTPRPTLDAAGKDVAPPPGADASAASVASAPPADDNVDSLMQSVDRIIANEKASPGAPATDDSGAVDNGVIGGDTVETLPPADDESGMPMDDSGAAPLDAPGGTADAPILLNDAPLNLNAPPADQYATPPPPERSPFVLNDPNSDPVPPADIPNPGSSYSSW